MLQQSLAAAAAVLLFSWTFKQNETFHKNAFIVPSSYSQDPSHVDKAGRDLNLG